MTPEHLGEVPGKAVGGLKVSRIKQLKLRGRGKLTAKIDHMGWESRGKKISGKEISSLRARNLEREHEVWNNCQMIRTFKYSKRFSLRRTYCRNHRSFKTWMVNHRGDVG